MEQISPLGHVKISFEKERSKESAFSKGVIIISTCYDERRETKESNKKYLRKGERAYDMM